jgi:hypothetical protein
MNKVQVCPREASPGKRFPFGRYSEQKLNLLQLSSSAVAQGLLSNYMQDAHAKMSMAYSPADWQAANIGFVAVARIDGSLNPGSRTPLLRPRVNIKPLVSKWAFCDSCIFSRDQYFYHSKTTGERILVQRGLTHGA